LVSEGGCEARPRLFYQKSEQKRLGVGAVGGEACDVMKGGAVQIRLGGNDANVIFGEGWIMGIQH